MEKATGNDDGESKAVPNESFLAFKALIFQQMQSTCWPATARHPVDCSNMKQRQRRGAQFSSLHVVHVGRYENVHETLNRSRMQAEHGKACTGGGLSCRATHATSG